MTYYLHKLYFSWKNPTFCDAKSLTRIRIRMDPHGFGSLDPDPHCRQKLDTDSHWNQCGSTTLHRGQRIFDFSKRELSWHGDQRRTCCLNVVYQELKSCPFPFSLLTYGGKLRIAVLRIQIRDPMPFLPLDPGWIRNRFIPDPVSRILDPGSRIPNS